MTAHLSEPETSVRSIERRVTVDKGATVPFGALPDHSVALDGYVQGPAIDSERRRFSFDHHAGCVRHATLSTCEMTLDAIRVGLEPADLQIYINDLDADTVLAVWLLLNPERGRAHDAAASIAGAVRSAGRYDALGPACGEGLEPALRWALQPMQGLGRALRTLPETAWYEILSACLARLDAWAQAGGPASHPAMPAPATDGSTHRVLHDGGTWRLVQGPGLESFRALYDSGVFAGVVARPLADDTWEYTVGKASEFVAGFDVPALLAALQLAEQVANPAQEPARSWGGGSTIGGSPRNADGSGSRLRPTEVTTLVARVLAAGDDSSRPA